MMVDGILSRPAGFGRTSARGDTNAERAKMLGQAPKTEATAGGAAVPQPRAELSDLAANALAPSSAPMNAEKVAALRTAIADGSYKVDPEAIAARMIDLDLGRAQ